MTDHWDIAFDNRSAVSDAGDWLAAWQRDAAAFRRRHIAGLRSDCRYGTHPRETYDVFAPEIPAAGTLVFIHGGYWRSMNREDHHHFAAGALARGWRVIVLEYPLCPEVSLESLCASVVAGIEHVAERFTGDIVVGGHSAGGHLATHAVTEHSTLGALMRERIRRIVSISGLHDLRPITYTTDLNASLELDMNRAAALSPALAHPMFDGDVLCLCGDAERPELRRQNALLADIWRGLGQKTRALELAGEHHFSVLDGLTLPGTALTRWLTLAHDLGEDH